MRGINGLLMFTAHLKRDQRPTTNLNYMSKSRDNSSSIHFILAVAVLSHWSGTL